MPLHPKTRLFYPLGDLCQCSGRRICVKQRHAAAQARIANSHPQPGDDQPSSSAGNDDLVQQVVLNDVAPSPCTRWRWTAIASCSTRSSATTTCLGKTRLPRPPCRRRPERFDNGRCDRSELAVGETVGVHADVELLGDNAAGTVIVGVDLPRLHASHRRSGQARHGGTINRYELTGHQVLLYVKTWLPGRCIRSSTGCRPAIHLLCRRPPAGFTTITRRISRQAFHPNASGLP